METSATGMYGDGANTLQMLLIFGGPFAGAVVAGFSSTSEHLRASGGMAFAAIMLFGSLGLFREIELVVVDGIKNDGAWVP
jgi:hypothetical protein